MSLSVKSVLSYLRCIRCDAENSLEIPDSTDTNIFCNHCNASYGIIRSIPRFHDDEAYTQSFGVEWRKHQLTQYDHYYGERLSQERFFRETGWDKDLSQQIIIEAGCGSGRFTEWALSTGAVVLSFDLSNAVEINHRNNGDHPNLFLAQADLHHIPFKKGVADKLFCFGVLQHTPSPNKALHSLIPYVKQNGGEIVFDIYLKKFQTKYLIRPFFKKISPEILYKLCKFWVNLMWPFASALRKVSPQFGPRLNWQLMIADHSREGVPEEKLKEWSYLDTFDMLSPRYDQPATLKEVESWLIPLREAKMIQNFMIKYGYNGIEGKIFK